MEICTKEIGRGRKCYIHFMMEIGRGVDVDQGKDIRTCYKKLGQHSLPHGPEGQLTHGPPVSLPGLGAAIPSLVCRGWDDPPRGISNNWIFNPSARRNR